MFREDSRANGVEANALTGMDHGEFSGHCENRTLHANDRVRLRSERQSLHKPTFEAVSVCRSVNDPSYGVVRQLGRTCQLGRSSTHDCDKARGVYDTPTLSQTLLRISLILPHGKDGVFRSPPDALEVYLHGEIPDLFFRIQGVVVFGVHDPSVVELQSVSTHILSLPKSLVIIFAGRGGVVRWRCQ